MTKFDQLMDDLQQISNGLEQDKHPDDAEVIDKAMDILHQINNWCGAYPEHIFIPMTSEQWKEHHEVLKSAERSGSAAAADSMRHVVNGIKKVLNQ